MTSVNDIFGLTKKCLNLAEKKNGNLKCAEVYLGKSKYLNIEIEENFVKNTEIGSDTGISIRTIDNRGSLGFAFTNNLT
ncbi:MAG: PmbA/TldA family metallopeptidase, partial [Promethearchaeota archaeon]